MKTALVRISAVVLVPEEWPADLSPGHEEDANRITYKSLNLPGAVAEIVSEMMSQLSIELKSIHPEIELSGIQVQ